MNCYFLSFGSIKELERIKKRLQRQKIKHTLNRDNLFILYYSDYEIELRNKEFEVDSVLNQIMLHKDHPYYSNFELETTKETNLSTKETGVSSIVSNEINIVIGGFKIGLTGKKANRVINLLNRVKKRLS